MVEHADNAPQGGDPRAGLGESIRVARKARGLEPADLAHCLRLEPRIIEALESEDYERLPPQAFVHGYLRALAKELGIEADPLLAQFDARSGSEPPRLADFESRPPAQISVDSHVVRYATIALAVAMVVMMVLWWQGQRGEGGDDGAVRAPEAQTGPASEPLDYDFKQITHSDAPYYRAPSDSGMPHTTAPATTEPAALDDPVADDTPAPEMATAETGMVTADEPAAEGDQAGIRIVVSDEAWVDVQDSSGRRLYFDLARPGQPLNLAGEAPYTLVIGNSPAVEVSYEGRPVDLQQFASDGVARFELGN